MQQKIGAGNNDCVLKDKCQHIQQFATIVQGHCLLSVLVHGRCLWFIASCCYDKV